jgi:hypothetical protein
MFNPLALSAVTMLVSLFSFGVATGLLVQFVVHWLRKSHGRSQFWKNIAILMILSMATALVHLIQIGLWALTIRLCGATSTFEDAFYCSAQNYTALGYGDMVPSGPWRLLGPLEAINGLLLFGLSTSLMFAVTSHLVASRLQLHLGQDR